MTQNEFFLRTLISLASNPKYVETKTTGLTTAPSLMIESILTDAEDLMEAAAADYINIFDDDSVNDKLDNLAKTIDGYDPHLVLDNIEDSLRDIARSIADINQSGILVDATVHDGD